VQVDNLVLIRRADMPRTTSGKIQRALLREASSAAA
jgi:acyl-coenzyme A synthetase/AMP-(fatty) acid ligase